MRIRITSVVLTVGFLAAVSVWCVCPTPVIAQAKPAAQTKTTVKSTSRPVPGKPPAAAERPPREVTMTGRLVSVHAFMTGANSSPDQTKSTADNFRAGVPAALDTPTGLILLGQGTTGVGRTLIPMAFQEVEVHGKLYEKGGLKYIDIESAEVVEAEEAEEEESEEEGE